MIALPTINIPATPTLSGQARRPPQVATLTLQREIITVENPLWTQRETSIVLGVPGSTPVVVLYNFGYDSNTICRSMSGMIISPVDALEGVKYGWYECRLLTGISEGQPVRATTERTARYSQDESAVGAALGAAGLLALAALVFCK